MFLLIGYSPIQFKGSTKVSLNLSYSFFYDLEIQNSRLLQENEDISPDAQGTTPARKRRKRTLEDDEREIQVVEVQFRLVEVRSSVLLYSKTSSSVHILMVIFFVEYNSGCYRLIGFAICPRMTTLLFF